MFGRKVRAIIGAMTLFVALTTALSAPMAALAASASVSQQAPIGRLNCIRYANGVVYLTPAGFPASFSTPGQQAYLAVEGWRAIPGQAWQQIGWFTQPGGGHWLSQWSGALREWRWKTAQGQIISSTQYRPMTTYTAHYYILRFRVQWADGQYRDSWSTAEYC